MKILLCFINQQFYQDYASCSHILDVKNPDKQGRRSHLCLGLIYGNNRIFIPLRSNLPNPNRFYGKIGYAVPTKKHPNAGLDYRNALVINDNKYLDLTTKPRIPFDQYRIIEKNYRAIKNEFLSYLRHFCTTYRKGRIPSSLLYKDTSLLYFLNELGLN